MKLFGTKRRHGRRSGTKAPRRRPVRPSSRERQLSRQWQRRFRKLLRMQDGNRRVSQDAQGRQVSGARDLLPGALERLGHGLAYLAVAGLVALLPVALWFGYQEILRAPHFFLREITVSGNRHVASDAIVAAAGLDEAVSTLTIDEDSAAEAVRNLPWVRTADVAVQLPRSAAIHVTERRASAVLAMGAQYLVDERGALFQAARQEDYLGLPVITGFQRGDFTDTTLQAESRRRLRQALAVLRAWRELKLEAAAPLSEVESHRVYGQIVRLREDGAEIWLGNDDYRDKLTRAADIIADLHYRGRHAKHIYLDTNDALQRVIVETDESERSGRIAGLTQGQRE